MVNVDTVVLRPRRTGHAGARAADRHRVRVRVGRPRAGSSPTSTSSGRRSQQRLHPPGGDGRPHRSTTPGSSGWPRTTTWPCCKSRPRRRSSSRSRSAPRRTCKSGQKAFAIGNPFGLSLTLTKGIISALDREIESNAGHPITGAIQIDAPINPGNSGGPLLDKDARLIGVNTAIYSPAQAGGNVGIGFAIPVDTVNAVVTELIRHGQGAQPDVGGEAGGPACGSAGPGTRPG